MARNLDNICQPTGVVTTLKLTQIKIQMYKNKGMVIGKRNDLNSYLIFLKMNQTRQKT